MRTRFPSVWSSRWTVKVPALTTLASFSNFILFTKQLHERRLKHFSVSSRQKVWRLRSLLLIFWNDEALVSVRGIHMRSVSAGIS